MYPWTVHLGRLQCCIASCFHSENLCGGEQFRFQNTNTTLNHFESTYLVLDIAILNLTRIDFPLLITNLNVLVNILDFLC